MGDAEKLLLILAIIYLLECVVWVPRGFVVLSQWWPGPGKLRHPGNLLSNRRGGVHLASPFPIWGRLFLSQQMPWSLSPQGLYDYTALCLDPADRLRHTHRWQRWEDIQTVAVMDRQILVNGEPIGRAISAATARFLARWLERIRTASTPERAERIRLFLRATLDGQSMQARWQILHRLVRPLEILSNSAFCYLFVVAPWLLGHYGWLHVGWWVLLGLLIQTMTLAWLFGRAHRILFPTAREARFKHLLTMVLAPPAALRAPHHLSRTALEEFHPLAVGRLMLSSRAFRALARQFLIDLRYPLLPVCPTEDAQARRTEAWFRTAMRDEIESYLQGQGMDSAQLLSLRPTADPESRSYCPRCQSQFTRLTGRCPDCGGRALEPWPA